MSGKRRFNPGLPLFPNYKGVAYFGREFPVGGRNRSLPSLLYPCGSISPRRAITMTRHKVYPKIRVYKEGELLRTTTAGSRSKIDSAEVEFNVDLKDESDVKVYVGVEVDNDGHGSVSLRFDTNLFELSINGMTRRDWLKKGFHGFAGHVDAVDEVN